MSSKGVIDKSPMWEDILSVIRGKDRVRNIHVSAVFHTEKEDYEPLKVLVLENKRDYYKSTGEYFTLTIYVATGDYVYRLVPFRDHLEVTLKTTYMLETGQEDPEEPPLIVRYKALITFDKNQFPSSDSISNRDIEELNLLEPLTVKMELQDRCEELLRLKTIDGVYRNVTTEQMLRGAFTHEANKAKVDGKDIVQIVELDPPDNKVAYTNLVIPNGTLLRDLPGYLQTEGQGVYKAGIGSFFQRYKDKPSWFVFPLYAPKRFDEDRTKLVVYAVPEDRMPSMNRTFKQEGKTIYVASTGEKKMVDNSRNHDLNAGNGFRMSDADAFMKKPVKINSDSISGARKQLNREVMHLDRKDKLNNARTHNISSNPYPQYSEILAGSMAAVSVVWQNAKPELLYPGMPVKYVSMEKGEYTETKGTLILAFSVSVIIGNPLQETNHGITVQMNILIQPNTDLPENNKKTSVGENR